MSKNVEFQLISKADSRIYLKGEVDIDTIDDFDGGDWEYEQNNGLFDSHIPTYWKTFGEDLTDEFNDFLGGIDWVMFRQYLVDFADEDETVNFYGNTLIINDGKQKSTTIRVKEKTKERLNEVGNKGESYDEIINKLIGSYLMKIVDG